MPTERIQRRIDSLLDEADEAVRLLDWRVVRDRAQAVLALDPGNEDASIYLATAQRGLAARDPSPARPVLKNEGAGAGNGTETRKPLRLVPTLSPLPADERLQLPESFVGGRYEVLSVLGQGGMGAVYEVRDRLLGRAVALKTILPERLNAPEVAARFEREAQALARLNHPNILTLYEYGQDAGLHYMVMEIGGPDLESLLDWHADLLPLPQAVEIAIGIARALDYAHANGVVHRDLKPGNVLVGTPIPRPLSPAAAGERGAASPVPAAVGEQSKGVGAVKVMDFGLAKMRGSATLTAAQAQVGTPMYMSPEQAMGQEATERSDLYALGAILYELVAGRPPFLGKDALAVIAQHLNAPPVAPSWHNSSVPPALESLILRLLEKDPAKRPQAAADVLHALSTMDLTPPAAIASAGRGERYRSSTGDGPGVRPHLYRRTFVGRTSELRQLQSAFDLALAGQGSCVMVVGEPGIGKTALCEQLAAHASARASRVLVGHSYEEGAQSLPYLAFVEALRSYVLARTPDALRAELGSGASDVARIVSDVRERLAVELRPAGDPDEDRWRLLQAVTEFLRHAAAAQPLVVVLEDLHWADRGTLDLLTHLARNLQGARLLLVGTYRDVEIDRTHPLAAALGELRRTSTVARVLLRGLPPEDVQQMLASIAGQEVSWGLAEAVHRQTEGNPLFVQEVVRYLTEEGLVQQGAGRWKGAGQTPLAISIPEGLRDVIGRRLSRLSPECNRLLAVAAVIGREFSLAALVAVAERSEDIVVAALEEALRVGVLEEQARVGGVQYRFAHAFFRQTLYEELSAARRIRLHQQVARTLEAQYSGGTPLPRPGSTRSRRADRGGNSPAPAPSSARSGSATEGRGGGSRLADHAAELAEHFTHSSDPEDLKKAVQYGEQAAARAVGVYAYAEAVRLLERALEVQEVLDAGDAPRYGDLLVALGEAVQLAGDPRRAAGDIAERAYVLAESRRDRARVEQACLLALRALLRYGSSTAMRTPAFAVWANRLDRWAEADSVARGWAEWAVGRMRVVWSTNPDELADAVQLLKQALERARRLGDSELFFVTATWLHLSLREAAGRSRRHALALEVAAYPREGASALAVGEALYHSAIALLDAGERAAAERLFGEAETIGERSREPVLQLRTDTHRLVLATLDGRLTEAAALVERLLQRGEEIGSPVAGRQFVSLWGVRALLLLGNYERALELATAAADGAGVGVDPTETVRQLVALTYLGRPETGPLLEQTLAQHAGRWEWADIQAMMLEAAIQAGDRAAVTQLRERLGPLEGAFNPFAGVCVDRLLGEAAALLGEREEARRAFERALAVAERLQHRPETALVHLRLAALLHGQGDKEGASAHLNRCITELGAMEMQPALEQAQALKEQLQG